MCILAFVDLGTILTALVTPFDDRYRVDHGAASRLITHCLDNGSDGVVMASTTGEASTLDDDEKIALYRLGRREADDAVVIANTGTNDTAHSVRLTHEAAAAGADAVLAVTPYYNKPPRAGIVAHFASIAEVGLPVIVYNIPGRSVLNLPPDLLAEIADIPHVVGVKQAHNDLDELDAVMAVDGFSVWAGNDDLYARVLERGGAGVISVASHLVGPAMARMAADARDGDMDAMRATDAELAGLYAALFAITSPLPVKAAMEMTGIIPSDRMRLPLVPATPAERDALRPVLEAHGVLAHA